MRKLNTGGVIKNLNFNNLEVRGQNNIGGIVGLVSSSNSEIKNINIKKLEIEGRGPGGNDSGGHNVGGVVGYSLTNSSRFSSISVTDAKIKGRSEVGGLVGSNNSILERSMFRGVVTSDFGLTSTTVGGLVGENGTSGNIQESFSEGVVTAMGTLYTGGIAGSSTSGIINNTYSTMTVSSAYPTVSTSKIGGIVGNGTAMNSYFDGIVANKGATPNYSIHKVKYGTIYNSCFGDFSSNAEVCTDQTYATLRQDLTSSMHPTVSAKWSFANGIIPRLYWETRECQNASNLQSVTAQVAGSRGTLPSIPVMICTAAQLADANLAVSKFYRIGDDINLSSWGEPQMIADFKGTLDGDEHALYGLSLMSIASGRAGIVKINNGTIQNLFVLGNVLVNGDATEPSGVLTSLNNGAISNIKVRGSTVMANNYVGGIAGINAGTITQSSIDSSSVVGTTYVGGITGLNMNSGVISTAMSKANIQNRTGDNDFHHFGSISGRNNGVIDQARVGGVMNFYPSSTQGAGLLAGGIAGENNGIITNVYTDDYFRLQAANSQRIGGLVGLNNNTLDHSFALGKILYNNSGGLATPAQTMHSLIGDANTAASNSLFLENTTASILNVNSVSNCSAGDVTAATTGQSALVAGSNAANLMQLNNSANAGILTLNSISVSTTDHFTMTGCLPGGTSVTLYRKYILSNDVGERAAADFSNIASFSGWDMGYMSASSPVREASVLAYYKSVMDKTPIPGSTPVWVLDEDDDYPELLQNKKIKKGQLKAGLFYFKFNLINYDPHITQSSGLSIEQTIAAICSSVVLTTGASFFTVN